MRPGSWMARSFTAQKACGFCGKVFTPFWTFDKRRNRKAVQSEPSWLRQRTCSRSCAKRLSNPMSNHQTRLKVRAKLREIRHKPIKRGGNGCLLPLPQLALLHALGEGWESEYPIKTGMRAGSGYPTSYKVDLANKSRMIAIEVDGTSHTDSGRRAQDAKKMNLLVSLGWSVYRVSNERALHLYSTFESEATLLTSLTGT